MLQNVTKYSDFALFTKKDSVRSGEQRLSIAGMLGKEINLTTISPEMMPFLRVWEPLSQIAMPYPLSKAKT